MKFLYALLLCLFIGGCTSTMEGLWSQCVKLRAYGLSGFIPMTNTIANIGWMEWDRNTSTTCQDEEILDGLKKHIVDLQKELKVFQEAPWIRMVPPNGPSNFTRP